MDKKLIITKAVPLLTPKPRPSLTSPTKTSGFVDDSFVKLVQLQKRLGTDDTEDKNTSPKIRLKKKDPAVIQAEKQQKEAEEKKRRQIEEKKREEERRFKKEQQDKKTKELMTSGPEAFLEEYEKPQKKTQPFQNNLPQMYSTPFTSHIPFQQPYQNQQQPSYQQNYSTPFNAFYSQQQFQQPYSQPYTQPYTQPYVQNVPQSYQQYSTTPLQQYPDYTGYNTFSYQQPYTYQDYKNLPPSLPQSYRTDFEQNNTTKKEQRDDIPVEEEKPPRPLWQDTSRTERNERKERNEVRRTEYTITRPFVPNQSEKKERTYSTPFSQKQPKQKKTIPFKTRDSQKPIEVVPEKQSNIELFEDKPETNLRDDKENLVGTSQALEKHYFRVKGIPKSSEVRPEVVLKQAFKFVMDNFKKTNDYDYICDQLKGIRQDLTLQHIEDEFSVQVYELHAHLSLENQDISEFIQCASALKNLYHTMKRPIDDEKVILYSASMILCNMDGKNVSPAAHYTLIRDIPDSILTHPTIQLALNIKKAFVVGDYFTFFNLYTTAITQFKLILVLAIDKVRINTAYTLFYAVRPTIDVEHFKKYLFFKDDEDYTQFITKHPIVFDDKGSIVCATSLANLTS
ncbi:leukocyte receptor cluster member, putative [Entamoeba invadens IP1]|uniref:Leukocyte receptor cluster member, putative n=1 Tax=Entamoeba invadens IP1 TaxID=370355 RepID=A0A0A1U0B9_ENTIV|nr:leukocyte receptor cluster member, putative [Entamoeba invadens IP1]ELP87324.1 leukocyte receptor cluster member, putative [Entamoeba invadens IP1]|eukprot:XP_004254095.1 leukocyte receptor cluster member, putative [Entamoeba invadens IP1]